MAKPAMPKNNKTALTVRLMLITLWQVCDIRFWCVQADSLTPSRHPNSFENRKQLKSKNIRMKIFSQKSASNLRSNRFRGLGEQRKTEERDFRLSPHFSRRQSIGNRVPRSFFVSQSHGNACYAGLPRSERNILIKKCNCVFCESVLRPWFAVLSSDGNELKFFIINSIDFYTNMFVRIYLSFDQV